MFQNNLAPKNPLNEILGLVIEFALGNLDARIDLSTENEDLNAISAGLNMLGEELQDRMVSIDQLTKTKSLLDSVLNSMPNTVLSINKNNTIVYVNAASEKMLGYTAEELSGQPFSLILNKKKYLDLLIRLDKIIKQKSLHGFEDPFEVDMRRKNGDVFSALLQLFFWQTENSELLVGCVLKDISKEKRAIETSARHIKELEVITYAFPEMYFWIHKDGTIFKYNAVQDDLFTSEENFLGKRFQEVLPKGVVSKLEICLKDVLSDKLTSSTEYWLEFPEGRRYFEARFAVLFADEIIISVRNVSENKKIQNQLFDSQKQEALGRLAGGIAHEMNNILVPVLNYSELLLEGNGYEVNKDRYLKQIFEAGKRAKEIVQQVLAISRVEKADFERIDLNKICVSVFELMHATIPKNYNVCFQSDNKPYFIYANETQISQIIINIVNNAHHAMEKKNSGNIVGMLKASDDGSTICLSISDDGEGISKALQKKIFEPFYTTKDVGKGTGLGLSVVKGILDVHKASIFLTSKRGDGTTFYIDFPLIDKKVNTLSKINIKTYAKGEGHILVVDDEAIIIELYLDFLRSLGYRVTAFNNSMEALKHFEAFSDEYDLMITDRSMPFMNGEELAQKMLSVRKIPIFMITGFAYELSKEKAKDLGIKQFFKKPVDLSDLADKLQVELPG